LAKSGKEGKVGRKRVGGGDGLRNILGKHKLLGRVNKKKGVSL